MENKPLNLGDQILPFIKAGGVRLDLLSAQLCAAKRDVLRAAFVLDASGRAILVRTGRGRAYEIYPVDSDINKCAVCMATFVRKPRSMRATCSKACQSSLAWRDPVKKANRIKNISAAQSTPEALARTASVNARRWSDPAQHAAASELNRQRWEDEEVRATISAKIRNSHNRPELRKFYSDLRKKSWADPVARQKMADAAANSKKVQAYREKMRDLIKERWADPEWRKKWSKANKERNTPELRAKNSARMKAWHAQRRAAKAEARA